MRSSFQGDTTQAAAAHPSAAEFAGVDGDGSPELDAAGSGGGSDEEEGNLRFLWAPRRMDGKSLTAVSSGPAAAGGDGGESSSSSSDGDSDSSSDDGGGSGGGGGGDGDGGVPLIMFALQHHRQAFTAADGLTDLGTSTLHGQVCVQSWANEGSARFQGHARP